jgi:cohesin loading factor subunit SCC2
VRIRCPKLHNGLLTYLQSARELTAVGWGHELTNALTHCNSILQRMEKEGESSDHHAFRKLADGVKSALRNVWQEAAHDVFDIG